MILADAYAYAGYPKHDWRRRDAAREALRTALATRNAAAAEVVRCFRTYGMTGETMDVIKALEGGAT